MPDTSRVLPNLIDLVSASPLDGGESAAPATVLDDGNQQPLAVQAAGPDVLEDGEPSDVRLKTDIEQVGTTALGLPLYHFRYTSGAARFEGVMAQDVLKVMPDAVSTGSDGFYRVNYRKLGIAMRAI